MQQKYWVLGRSRIELFRKQLCIKIHIQRTAISESEKGNANIPIQKRDEFPQGGPDKAQQKLLRY